MGAKKDTFPPTLYVLAGLIKLTDINRRKSNRLPGNSYRHGNSNDSEASWERTFWTKENAGGRGV